MISWMMRADLDNPAQLESLDKGRVLKTLMDYPEHSRRAIRIAEDTDLDIDRDRAFNTIVFAGIGGSAIGGQLVRDWLLDKSTTPMFVSRGYKLPGFVGEDTLVFVISYSGNTEETISAFNQATSRKCRIISFTSGGILERLSEENGIPVVKMPGGFRSRMALPYQLFTIATVLRRLGFVGDSWGEVEEAINHIEKMREEVAPNTPTEVNVAKQIAVSLVGRFPLVYGPQSHKGVGYRFSTQLNENSKVPSGSGTYPEIFHNIILGSEASPNVLSPLALIIISDPTEKDAMVDKILRFKALFQRGGGRIIELKASGPGRLARMLSVIYTGDFVSVYLGLLYGRDPSSQNAIDEIKRL
jgi:glucose/mannose-6-phosphate isomerase